MKFLRLPVFALTLQLLCAFAPAQATAAPANCTVPKERILQRIDFDLSGDARVSRSVDIPADSEVMVELFESNTGSLLEVRVAGAEVVSSKNPLERWGANRLLVAKGPARKADISVTRLERTTGAVAVRLWRITPQDDPRCGQFWRAMASGDVAYARGDMIYRGQIAAPAGESMRAYETAVAAYTRALRVLGPGGFDEALAQLIRSGALLDGPERNQEAADAAHAAEASFVALGDEYGRDQARFWYAKALVAVAFESKNEAEANREYELARSIYVQLAADHLRRGERYDYALALGQAAAVDTRMNRFPEAIAGYQRAIEAFNGLNEPSRTVTMRQNLAYLNSQMGRYREALKTHEALLAEGDKNVQPGSYFANLVNMAYAELKLGRYDAALRHYSDAYARGLRAQYRPFQSASLHGLGNTYRTIGNYDEALAYLQRALELRTPEFPQERSGTLRSIANVLKETGRAREAIERREEALRLVHGPMDKSRLTLELIDDRIEVGDLAIAKSLVAPLLAGTEASDPTIQANATLANARIELAEGEAAGALRDSRTATAYYHSQELVDSEFTALLLQARAACAAGARDRALDIAETALQRAEEIRTFSNNPTLRASLWRSVRPAFGFTIGVLARPNSCGGTMAADSFGALAIAEASRARALEDFRQRSTVTPGSQPNESRRELFEQLAGVRQQLETLAATVSSDDPRLKALRLESGRLRREIDLSGGLPDVKRHRAADLGPALRARIDAIPADTAMIEYWLDEDDAFAWLLTRGRAQLVDLGPAGRIDAAARRMNDAMRNWLTSPADARVASARELHDLVIAPLGAELARTRTLYFIPDGALYAVPFAALASGERTRPRFLLDSHDVAVAPAFLAIPRDAERRELRRNSPALVVVDPVYASDDRRFTRAADPAAAPQAIAATLRGPQTWVRLPATAHEAATITKLLDQQAVRVLSGFDASRESLLGSDLAKYDILHFATHAVADTEAPQLSALILSTLDPQGKPRAGEVFAGDLADQRMNATLVVFSGCETALGRAEAGEGLLGLRYAAHAAGAHAVIASLWPVEDAAGARLMDDLYADVISRNSSPVAALARAMRNARKRSSDPALWAAFDVSVAGF